jgi:transcriptional regulator GlxA family with amidase domain
VASICSGAFLLAATGLLDGRRATTHWLAAAELARRHRAVEVDPDVLYVDNGPILTSAGAAAGFDLCLHLVRRDLGARAAAMVARRVVMPLERAGGQAQFIVHSIPTTEASLQPLLSWIEGNLAGTLDVPTLARRAKTSVRTFRRRFQEQTGTTPAKWVNRARVRRAQTLMESTDLPVERVAEVAGFGSAAVLRERFAKLVGTSPQSYRRAFRAHAP